MDYTATTLAWQNTANKAPLLQRRIFARDRGVFVKQPVIARTVTGISAHQGTMT
ncbi:TPA: hypothetical protein JC757_004715 [Salmonella enterica subsp. diarizonae]|nr:hypothetical protein [Salmonella enterica subsp. diarizonae]